jgi:hypothetical protein
MGGSGGFPSELLGKTWTSIVTDFSIAIQSNVDKRDCLKREKALTREVFRAF